MNRFSRTFTRSFLTLFTGAQPTGSLHLGNYFGAIQFLLRSQNDPIIDGKITSQRIFSIVDMHSMTAPGREGGLAMITLNTAAMLLATGLDPNKTILFRQSDVLEHSALMWILMCHVTVNRLSRMIQWKEKAELFGENCALHSYPILQAADVLLYKADVVPVGPDQVQHLELVCDIAQKFNNRYQIEVFKIPKPIVSESRVKSLRNPLVKMSKSDPQKDSCIFLEDTPELIKQKILRAVTDSDDGIQFDQDISPQKVTENYKNDQSFFKFKTDLADILIEMLEPIRRKYIDLVKNLDYVEALLTTGAEKARSIAARNLSFVKDIVFK